MFGCEIESARLRRKKGWGGAERFIYGLNLFPNWAYYANVKAPVLLTVATVQNLTGLEGGLERKYLEKFSLFKKSFGLSHLEWNNFYVFLFQ